MLLFFLLSSGHTPPSRGHISSKPHFPRRTPGGIAFVSGFAPSVGMVLTMINKERPVSRSVIKNIGGLWGGALTNTWYNESHVHAEVIWDICTAIARAVGRRDLSRQLVTSWTNSRFPEVLTIIRVIGIPYFADLPTF